MDPLISVEELAERLETVRLCDVRWSLNDPRGGRAAHARGHIPGAVFVDLDADLADPAGRRGRHPLPSPERFADTLGRLGISPGDAVVAYDDAGGRVAARLWWMLRATGHEDVRVLDGGFQAWTEQGLPLETGEVTPQPTTYPSPPAFGGVVTLHDLEGRVLIDARSPERYRGEVEPVDPKAGHIPGAINIPTELNLDERGHMRSADALRHIYGHLGSDVIMSCGSGVTACHDALAMVRAGLAMPDVYVGSFSEWSRHDLPVKTGPDP